MPPSGKRGHLELPCGGQRGPVRDTRGNGLSQAQCSDEPSQLLSIDAELGTSSQQNDLCSEEPQELSVSRLTPRPSSSNRVVAQVSGRRA